MKNSVFLAFSLILTAGIAYLYGEARYYFHRPSIYIVEIKRLQEQVAREKFRHQLTTYEFQDFRQYVATLLPEAIKEKGSQEKSYPLRSLASVVQKGSRDGLLVQRAQSLFEKGKSQFREKDFVQSNKTFLRLIDEHSYSAHVPEALFLLVEGYFQLREYDQVIRTVDKMVDLYPELELTGFALLRAGKVYEFRDRHDEAISVYQTVMRSFPNRQLSSVAQDSLREIEL